MYWYVRAYTSNYRNYSETGFRGTHCDAAMLPGPTERVEPEVESENPDPHPCEEDDEYFQARPNAEEMEEAISKFMDGMPALELDLFQQLHRQLARLPLPDKKVVNSMTLDEAVDGGVLKTMSEDELKRFTPSELDTSTHRNTGIYKYELVHTHMY